MATVRFSGDLVDKIQSNARDTFQQRISNVAESAPDNFVVNFYNWMFSETIHIINQLPDGFMETRGNFSLNSIRLQHDPNSGVGIHKTFQFATPMRWPDKFNNHSKIKAGGWSSGDNIEVSTDATDPVGMGFYNFFDERNKKLNALREQQTKFVDGVITVCGSYTTLAPALKAWPPLWDLIPQEYKDRHLEVKERKSATETTKQLQTQLDLTQLTATVVASKLTR